jgi:hypothetical protein
VESPEVEVTGEGCPGNTCWEAVEQPFRIARWLLLNRVDPAAAWLFRSMRPSREAHGKFCCELSGKHRFLIQALHQAEIPVSPQK